MPAPDFIETYSGATIRPLAPDPDDILIIDIAHALSNQCRFSGHTLRHYSVAQHSVHVAQLVYYWGGSKQEALWGLLHDASEAYLVDLPTPLKVHESFWPYREAEKHLQAVICERFGLPTVQPPAVTRADAIMLATEVRDLMHPDAEYWQKLTEKPYPELLPAWVPGTAKARFLLTYRKLATNED